MNAAVAVTLILTIGTALIVSWFIYRASRR